MRWATSRCWSAAPSSNSSDPTGSDKQPPRPSARTPASAEVRHPAPGHRQPTAPTSRRPPKSCDRQTAPATRRKIPAARLLRRQSAANHNHTRTSQPAAASPPHNSRQQKKRSGLSRRELEPFFSTGHHPHRKRGSIGGIRPRNEHRPVGLSSSRTAATCRFPQPT